MIVRDFSRSFAGGEITPELRGRVDLSKYQTGLAECKNMIPLPHGPVKRRPGTTHVGTINTDTPYGCRLVPFAYSASQTLVIVLDGDPLTSSVKTRWVTMGQFVLDGGSAAVSWSFFTEGRHLRYLKYAQANDVITLCLPGEANPVEGKRMSATNWSFLGSGYGPAIDAVTPPGVVTNVVSPDEADGKVVTLKYQVTAVTAGGAEESPAVALGQADNDLSLKGAMVKLTWQPLSSGASSYNIYKSKGGSDYGYIGRAVTAEFTDDNIEPNLSLTPPRPPTGLVPWDADKTPHTVAYHGGRKWYANTHERPQSLWAARPQTRNNMWASFPPRADDAFSVNLSSGMQDAIEHLVSFGDLLAFTASGEWRIFGPEGEGLSPSNIAAKTQGYAGCNHVRPIVTPNSVLFVQRGGTNIREGAYSNDSQSFASTDVTLMAPHLLRNSPVEDMALSRSPYPILWVAREDGALLSLTYLPEQEVYAWAQHDVGGKVKSLCTVRENSTDVLYLAVEREYSVNPDTGHSSYKFKKTTLERMLPIDQLTAFAKEADYFMDCGGAFEDYGATFTSVSGINWLKGVTVSVVLDGKYAGTAKVQSSGVLYLPYAANRCVFGIYSPEQEAHIKTLPLASQSLEAAGQGVTKTVNRVHLQVDRSQNVMVGPSENRLRRATNRRARSDEQAQTGEVSLLVDPAWGPDAAVIVRQKDPIPLMITSMTLEVQIGG